MLFLSCFGTSDLDDVTHSSVRLQVLKDSNLNTPVLLLDKSFFFFIYFILFYDVSNGLLVFGFEIRRKQQKMRHLKGFAHSIRIP